MTAQPTIKPGTQATLYVCYVNYGWRFMEGPCGKRANGTGVCKNCAGQQKIEVEVTSAEERA